MTEDPELDARPVDVQELFGQPGVRYVTPDFQRPFEWGEEQFLELWDDVKTASDRSDTHFLGQVILVDSSSAGSDLMEIIDGQQRFTSISILVCALRDSYKENGETGRVNQLDNLLSATAISDAKKQRRLRLLNHDLDDSRYNHIYSENPEQSGGNVGEAYSFFSQKIESLDKNELDSLTTTLLKRVKLIRTETGDINSAYQVFQTENDRGMDLSALDLVKSILFEAAAKDPDTDSEYVKENWLGTVSKLDKIDQAGARRPISHILGVSEFECEVQMYPKQFVRVFQDIVRNQLPAKSMTPTEFVDFLNTEAELYVDVNAPAVEDVVTTQPREIERRTRKFRYKNAHGGVAVYHMHKNYSDKQYLMKALDLATILSVRLNLSDKTASNKRDPMYKVATSSTSGDLLEDIKRIIRRRTPTDNALYENVANRRFKQNQITKLVLLELEREHFSNNHHSMTIDDFQLEHIAPRKSFSKDQYTPWRAQFDHDKDMFKDYRERLGNLTPLASKQNARAGANPLEDKKPEYRNSEFTLTQQICQYNKWGYDEIKQRSEDLAELVVKTWSIE